MFNRKLRWFGAAAAAVLVGVGLYAWFELGSRSTALGKVLSSIEKAETLHVRYTRGDKQLDYWHTSQPQHSRWEAEDGTYYIADSTTYWSINESANQARRRTLQPEERGPSHQLLDLLRVPGSRLTEQPVERVRDGDEETLTYRWAVGDVNGKPWPNWLDVRRNVKSGRINSLQIVVESDGRRLVSAELVVLAYDAPIPPAQKFAIADTLTEDGRIGKVTDVQGIVSLKPVLHERWTPVREHLVLRPGDWVRTDARGANATALRLMKQTGVILGPKTLVELIGPKQIRLIEGEIEITPTAGATVELFKPQGKIAGLEGPVETVKSKQVFRVEKEKIARVEKDPPWLLGFKGAAGNETLGSLVALVDGRNVPLSVGYHKVTVDIRDQIARTVIEESFVNHTDAQLEGVFYFPLPQDASISGFGMWIGNELVEADIVEKQRAREIYEQILREKRDPGLLEWSGGNIFKARVFPILAHSEKRIKISYTQVLPMKGNRYRYSYALQSELLQQHPLRELAIDVKVNSAVPLKSVTSPTHPTRDDRTSHSAHVEFTAQEYTPTRDFEVVVETEGRNGDVVMIPHRRGDDGYFMLQLTPPGTGGDWDRALLPNGEPLHVLILADTSASIDASQRATQATFIGALLSSLTAKDTFNLATCDVTCDWAFGHAKAADATNINEARDILALRTSLGWTDLDATYAAALKQCGPNTHVIYVGDGIVTTGDADPVAFTKRLKRLVQGRGGVFHAVTLGSSFEPGVMKAIASLGGGALRRITSEQGPAAVAQELLSEIAQPALRDIKVEFKGFRVARLYPESLANVPAGTQQILLGRYLPEGRDQEGEIIVTGTQGGKPVRFSTRATLKDAEQGNSFIPRLWARMHLDTLLDQGTTEAIKEEIIALSEEFHIITPYTSLLVLETDADRERFKVKRRFLMRDGERFFADGRDNALFDLKQKQMKAAGEWRTALRRSVLAELSRLGREPGLFQQAVYADYNRRVFGTYNKASSVKIWNDSKESREQAERLEGIPLGDRLIRARTEEIDGDVFFDRDDRDSFLRPEGGRLANELLGDGTEFGVDLGLQATYEFLKSEPAHIPSAIDHTWSIDSPIWTSPPFAESNAPFNFYTGLFRGEDGAEVGLRRRLVDGYGYSGGGEYPYLRAGELNLAKLDIFELDGLSSRYASWLSTLFPTLHAPPRPPREAKSTWPAPARELVKSLLRTEQLAKLKGGLEITRQSDSIDTRWDELSARSRRLELVSATSWLTRSETDGSQAVISWCDDKEIGVFSRAFQLGRVRKAVALDVQPPPLYLADYSISSLEQSYASYTPTLEQVGKDRTLLTLKQPRSPLHETRILIDSARHVILSMEDHYKGKLIRKYEFSDFVEVAGSWWAQRFEYKDAEGKRQSLITQTVKTLTQKELDQRVETELAGRAQVQLLQLPLPGVLEAKKALKAGKATFDDHFTLLLHFTRSQQWPRVLDHLSQAEKLAGDKPGLRWVRSALLNDSRRLEDLRLRNLEDAARLAKSKPADAYFLGLHLVSQSSGQLQANEMLALLDTLKPLYDAQPAHLHARKSWLQMRVGFLNQAGRPDEALAVRKQIATDFPRDSSAQRDYAQALFNNGDRPGAYAWLTRVLVKEAKWLPQEAESLRGTYSQFLQQQGRYKDWLDYAAQWSEQNPASRPAHVQHLSALVMNDDIDKAEALALRWVKEGQVAGELPPPVDARLHAAVHLLLGQGYNIQTNRVEERWREPLKQAVLFFFKHETHAAIADEIMNSSAFTRTDEAAKLRKSLANTLVAEIDKLPIEQLQRLINWVRNETLEKGAWDKAITRLQQRWTNEQDAENKHRLGVALIQLISTHKSNSDLLAFLRLQLQTSPEDYREAYTNQLFQRLLQQPWTAEIESEAIGLLTKLSTAEESGERLRVAISALHRLTDTMLTSRTTALNKTLEHPEKLTRTELQKKQAEFSKKAREELSDRLRKEAGQKDKALGQWFIAESVYLDLPLDRNLKQAADDAWAVVGKAPVKLPEEPTIEQVIESVLRHRYLVTVSYLAARRGAEPALVERLIAYHDKGIEAEPRGWKIAKYRLLIALDRTKDLEQSLKQWAAQEEFDSGWRVALGYLLAEQGRLPEAIQQFETVEAADELGPSAYRALAAWYQVQNQRDQHERASGAVYKTMAEHQLRNVLDLKLRPWLGRGGQIPTELDPEVLRVFPILFDKSATPQSYLGLLQQYYQHSRDFRLLSGLPDAVIGQTAARVYPFVQGIQGVLAEVREEATADEIVKRISEVRPRAKTVVDQRALDLLELLIERRAAELQNQPGPHRDKALAALVRASKREWTPGEPPLMASFLASLGRVTQAPLADEQLRQLKALHKETAAGSIDRLNVDFSLSTALSNYAKHEEASDVLQAALNEFQNANGGVLPVSANNALSSLVGILTSAGHYARAEKVLLDQLAHPVHLQQRRWLQEALQRHYTSALSNGGEVSLGKGAVLYQALRAKIQADLADDDAAHRDHTIDRLILLHRIAHDKKYAGVADDLKTVVYQILPPYLKQYTSQRESHIGTIAQALYDVVSPREGMSYLLDHIEQQPRWLRFAGKEREGGYLPTLGEWRMKAADLGDVENRLLKLVLAELRRDLETQETRYRGMVDRRHKQFWKEKADEFAKVAEEVLKQRGQSGSTALYVADYFYMGLDRPGRAIEILFAAHKQNLLDDAGQYRLVNYLHDQGRHAESIALLQALMDRHPEHMDYRVRLMHSYFRTGRKADLLALLKQTDAYFFEKDRSNEYALEQLAQSTLQNELFELSVGYYKEVIPLHERTHPGRGVGNGTLAVYYRGMARAYAGLLKTPEAVDAASAAIVAWGPGRNQRSEALDTLKEVLRRSADLDGFVVHFDKQKQDSAIIRKALGQVYADKKEHTKAIKQLELAAGLQPGDTEIYRLLIASYDALGDKEGARRQLLQAVKLSRRDLKLYEDLGKRYAEAQQDAEAERAYTSIVEMLPTEAESHSLLAEVREKQNRWKEAIFQWEQVARLRALEPTGLLKLAAAQMHEKQWEAARETLRRLNSRTWPAHFNEAPQQIRMLEEQLAKSQAK